MARSLPLPAVAWIVTIMLPHAVQPTLEEGDHSPNDETIPVNASRQETNSVVDITNVWPNISEPTRSKTHGNVTGTLGGRFAWPVGLRQGLSAYSIESVSIVPEVPARVSKYSDGGLRVSLSKCAHAVLGADVTVTVEKKASGETANLRLYDDGVGVDKEENDGQYSATMVKYYGNGKYSINITAANTTYSTLGEPRSTHPRAASQLVDGSINLAQSFLSSPEIQPDEAAAIMASRQSPAAAKHIPSISPGEFQLAVSFSVDITGNLKDDQVPPDIIRDLTATYANLRDGRPAVNLTWRSTGDHGCEGTADKYDLRMSTNSTVFKFNFYHGNPVHHVIDGVLKPQPPRTRQHLTVALPKDLFPPDTDTFDVHYRLVIISTNGIMSEPSKLASVSFPMLVSKQSTTNAPSTNAGKEDSPENRLLLYVAIGNGVAVVLAAGLGLICYSRARRPRAADTGHTGEHSTAEAPLDPLANPEEHQSGSEITYSSHSAGHNRHANTRSRDARNQ